MTKPAFFSQIPQLDKLESYDHMPKAVIVEISDEIESFLTACYDHEDFEASFDDVVAEVVMYISHDGLAEQGINQLWLDIYNFHSHSPQGVNPTLVADGFKRFAQGLHHKFKTFGMYTKEGILVYAPAARLDEHTLYMQRFVQGLEQSPWRQKKMHPVKIHHTMGLYRSGDRKHNGVSPEKLQRHIGHNLAFRPGRAFFVDGKCIYPAGMDPQTIAQVEAELAANPVVFHQDSAPYH